MKRITYFVLAAAAALFFTQTARAQVTLAYATADYDSDTNTVYGFTYTNTDYSSSLYYSQTYVGASINDANGTLIDTETQTAYNTRAEVNLEGPGTGYPPYKVSSGHMVFMSYYVYNYYDPYSYQYRNGYLDYYYYTYYTQNTVSNRPILFYFTGRSPSTVVPSIQRFLGTLLSSFLPFSDDAVSYQTAAVENVMTGFNSFNQTTLPLSQTSGGSGYCAGGATQEFIMTVDFLLPSDATSVSQGNSFVSESSKSQFQHTSMQFNNISLSPPKSGQVILRVYRKHSYANYPDNKVRMVISGTLGGGQTFSTPGSVKLTCN